ncbi:MAG: hypothetical protein CSB34_04990 [Desulfobulbus propionicus]|nr:MAG: hypothetical protein CSB34_04990 [Desulfobulbus propionicus]
MIINERGLILEEEQLIIRTSGEIPEVALHSSIDYLCHDKDGPGMVLTAEELDGLHGAVTDRYFEIILRDLTPENRLLPAFRGVERARINWTRLVGFCGRVGLDASSFLMPVRNALLAMIALECKERQQGTSSAAFNCSCADLKTFLSALDIATDQLPAGWQDLCATQA